MKLLYRPLRLLSVFEKHQTKPCHFPVSKLNDYIRRRNIKVPKEFNNLGWINMERHTPHLHSPVDIILIEVVTQIDVFRMQLFLTKILPVFVRYRVQFNPAMAYVLALHFVESAFGIIFALEQASSLPCHASIVVPS